MTEPSDSWRIFKVDELLAEQAGAGRAVYSEFLKASAMSLGIYRLPAGSRDMQGAHDDDEVYLVMSGRARMRLGDVERAVGPGSLLYVSATTEHSFFEIEEDMTLLVMFAASPLEHS